MKYYIGVDGGGTKTAYALFDEYKKMLAVHEGTGSNHENLEGGFEEAARVIFDGLNALCEKAGISLADISCTLMGLAGIDHPWQHDRICALLRKGGLSSFYVYNDGFIVVKAGSETGAAIGYNCGTGVCCNGIGSDGKMLQLMGLGEFSGDISGGQNIAVKAYELVYNELYLMMDKTLITGMVKEAYGLETREDFRSLAGKIEGPDYNDYVRDFVGFFFEAAKQGDKPALAFCEQMAERGARAISALASQLCFPGDEVEVVLSGSINTKLDNKAYLDMLLDKAQAYSGRKLKFIKLTAPPVTGCINWIMELTADQGGN